MPPPKQYNILFVLYNNTIKLYFEKKYPKNNLPVALCLRSVISICSSDINVILMISCV